MTDRQIKKAAFFNIRKQPDTAILTSLYYIASVALVILIEMLISLCMRIFTGIKYMPFRPNIDLYNSALQSVTLLVLRLAAYYFLFISVSYFVNRFFINFTDNTSPTDRFVSWHWRKLYMPSISCSIKLSLFKLLVASPLSVGIYGIIFFSAKSTTDDISIFGMVCFMLSIGFTLVWLGELVHYYISLSLVKYIIELNPRANFFDACDLSIKLMNGKHMRVISFYVSLIPAFLICLFIYPIFFILPYIIECRLVLTKDIMGSYWQDKIPAMARRWEKRHQRRRRR